MHYSHKKEVAARVDAFRANAEVNMDIEMPRSPAEAGMSVKPAADAAYLLPTLERSRNKLLDLTTRNNLLNLSLKSQRTAKFLSTGHINQACCYPLLNMLFSRTKRVIKLATSNESRQIQPKPDRGTCISLAAVDTQRDELLTIKAKNQSKEGAQ